MAPHHQATTSCPASQRTSSRDYCATASYHYLQDCNGANQQSHLICGRPAQQGTGETAGCHSAGDGLPVYDGTHSTPHCVSFCSKCTQHSQLRPVHRPHAAAYVVPLMSAAARHVINACGSLHVTVAVEPPLYAASPVAASPGSVQHQSGSLRRQKGCCKQPVPKQVSL